jgi:hypothetical protein
MQRNKTFMRAVAATFAIAAIAAPASLARPIDPVMPETQAPATEAPAPAPPARPLDRYTPQAPQWDWPLDKGAVYWAYDYEAGRPQDRPASTSDDAPWAIIGLAITAACLLVGGAAMASRSHVRARRARVAA